MPRIPLPGGMEWIGLAFKALFWGILVLVVTPVLLLLRVDSRVAGIDDGVVLDYDDNDLGVDVDV